METGLRQGVFWSGVGHAGAIVWILLGDWLFAPSAAPEIIPMQVSMISAAEFDAMQSTAPQPTP
ncbi:MAG: cell envelope biogenesis protein TolA, partial [Rhodobacteraceae bacterium]|nr:cell envelope biogenesis protein TolA [Paracoccaceae bacterium]